jgi:hypothetical protein
MRRDRLKVAAALGSHVPWLGVSALVFCTLNKGLNRSPVGYDEQFFVWGGWCIRKGLVPYRDFAHFKPPVLFLTHALAQVLCGLADGGYRTFFAALPLVALLSLQTSLVARGVARFIAMAAIVDVMALFVSPTWHDASLSDSESIGLSYYILGLALFLWEGRFTKATLALGGFFMTCCLLSNEAFLPIVVSTFLGTPWLRGEASPTRQSVFFFGRYSLLGVLLFTLLLCLYMVPTGSMTAYIEMASRYTRTYRGPQSYCAGLGLVQPSTPMGGLAMTWEKLRATFLREGVLGFLAPLAVAGMVFAYRRSRALCAAIALVGVASLWATTASQCAWSHYYTMAMAGVVFVLAAGVDSMRLALRVAGGRVRTATGVAAATLAALHVYPDLDREARAEYSREPWREPRRGITTLIAENTTPADRIFTTGPPLLYAETDRVSAVRESNFLDEFLASLDGATDEDKVRPFYLQLERNKPKIVFLDPEHEDRKVRINRSLVLPFVTAFAYKKLADGVYVRP